jgi:putative transposase
MPEPRVWGKPTVQRQANRTPPRRNPRPTKPQEWWGIDRTKGLGAGCGGLSLVLVREWAPQTIVGSAAGRPCPGQQWRAARAMAGTRQGPEGAHGPGRSRMREHGCQPTSVACRQAGHTLGSPPGVTRDHPPTGTAATARVLRPLNAAWRWQQEWNGPFAWSSALEHGIVQDNAHDRHSTLSAKSPRPWARESHLRHGTQFTAA